ncbi:MAG: hypothetical protein ACMXYD_05000 [Candidatus Woesearchaeota archaeon]
MQKNKVDEKGEHYKKSLVSTINHLRKSESLNQMISEGKMLISLEEGKQGNYTGFVTPIHTLSKQERKNIYSELKKVLSEGGVNYLVNGEAEIGDNGKEYTWKTNHRTYTFQKVVNRKFRQMNASRRMRNLEQGKSLDAPFDPSDGLIYRQKYFKQ